jgi:hypothetical protein
MYLTSIPYLARSCLYVVPNCSALRLEVFASRIFSTGFHLPQPVVSNHRRSDRLHNVLHLLPDALEG